MSVEPRSDPRWVSAATVRKFPRYRSDKRRVEEKNGPKFGEREREGGGERRRKGEEGETAGKKEMGRRERGGKKERVKEREQEKEERREGRRRGVFILPCWP